MKIIKAKLFKWLAGLFYRLSILTTGPITRKELAGIMESEMCALTPKSWWARIKREAYKREYSAYITALDSWACSETDDPFIGNKIIVDYLEEFTSFSLAQTYSPGGIINTELLLLYCLIRWTEPEVFIESGTKNGYSSVFIAEALSKNSVKGELHCVSMFDGDEKRTAESRLQKYSNATIHEGRSEQLIEELGERFEQDRVAMLVDGPKASTPAWDVLVEKVVNQFQNLLFLCFDSVQEHLPYWTPTGEVEDSKRSINLERLKMMELYKKKFQSSDYSFTIQSNRFCREYSYLNAEIFEYRNNRWGGHFKWGPYSVNRFAKHIAHSYKLGTIYRRDIISDADFGTYTSK